MANLNEPATISCYSFADFPEDVQLCVLSFLSPAEIANFACTSKQSVLICRSDSKLWYTLCDRRWGSQTQIRNWGNGQISYKLLYKTLDKWENLIGFWRRCGNSPATTTVESPSLIFFEWGPSFLAGSRVSPSRNGTYHVIKSPFLYLGISSEGQIVSFLDSDGCNGEISVNIASYWQFGYLDNNLIPVNVDFMGNSYFTVEENRNLTYSSPESNKNCFKRSSSSSNLRGEEEEAIEVQGGTPGSLPEMSEMYQHLANRTRTGAVRRQRRREKERQATRRRWETEHFVKVVECSPTLARPLQGLWKLFLSTGTIIVHNCEDL
ncbi:F-box protein At3g12350 isoform X2 [Tripterygium wilfordii]|uniref:F-box protein At3g12350 isoform X2 n=1 Tax=Tripterygium wilfordii TaxID=458696 RepID=UPI0018F8389B|nr:F-box protein At3g12350 isoform X2 [Tripterygium wilfordii]